MDNLETLANKRQRKPNGQSRKDNPEKLAKIMLEKTEGAIKNGRSKDAGK